MSLHGIRTLVLVALTPGAGPGFGREPSPAPVPPIEGGPAEGVVPGRAGLAVRAVRIVTPGLRLKLRLREFEGGVVLDHVYAGTPAAAAGLEKDDVVRTLDGVTLRDPAALSLEPAKRAVGSEIEIEVHRGAESRIAVVKLFDAVSFLDEACRRGDARACGDLGRRYGFGWGVAKDGDREAALYQQACEGGDAQGCHSLGALLYNGEGVPKDSSRALSLFQKACDAGFPNACSGLGAVYWTGTAMNSDPMGAIALFQQACEGGSANGCQNLGWAYHTVLRDDARAAALFRTACDGAEAHGCNHLGRLYEDGAGVTADPVRAAALYKQACQAGATEGCDNLRRLSARTQAAAGSTASARVDPGFEGLYRGTIAGKDVMVVVQSTSGSDGVFEGRYAYLQVGGLIPLDGRIQDGTALLEEKVRNVEGAEGREPVSGRWSGRFSKTGFRGTWTSPDGRRRHRIELSRQLAGDGRGNAIESGRKEPRRLDDVLNSELARGHFEDQREEVVVAGVGYRMVRHTNADISYPRLTRLGNKAVMARINSDLEKDHLERAARALELSPSVCRNCEAHTDVTVELFSPDFLSLSISESGLSPRGYQDDSTVTYDLKTGNPIDLGVEFLPAEGRTLRRDFLPTFLKHVRAQDPKWTEDDLRSCRQDEHAESAFALQLALSPNGLVVWASFERNQISAGCRTKAVVPYAELARWRKKDSAYRFGPTD